MKIKKTTPLLCVESIEASLPFWTETLGYDLLVDMPHDGKMGFALLQKDGSEVMLQTLPSIASDIPTVAGQMKVGATMLYSDVDSIEAAMATLKSAKLLVPLRTTEYGAKEIFVQNADGTVLGFAEFDR